jgi:hypothetical protein
MHLIDKAMVLCEQAGDGLRGWSNGGGAAGTGLLVAYRAHQLGHPDVADLVARSLALRSEEYERDANTRAQTTVTMAGLLAMYDPSTARHLLTCAANPEDYVTQAMNNDRNWLFALALADPNRAIILVDAKLNEAKTKSTGKSGLQRSGFAELVSILTKSDRFEDLASYSQCISDRIHSD